MLYLIRRLYRTLRGISILAKFIFYTNNFRAMFWYFEKKNGPQVKFISSLWLQLKR